jgi:hypothetical protein
MDMSNVYIEMVHCADNLIVLGRLAGQQTGFSRRLKAKVVYGSVSCQTLHTLKSNLVAGSVVLPLS